MTLVTFDVRKRHGLVINKLALILAELDDLGLDFPAIHVDHAIALVCKINNIRTNIASITPEDKGDPE